MTTNLRIKNILDQQLQTGRLAHAYLFVGPQGVGKQDLAMGFAAKVIASENLLPNPDYAFLDCSQGANAEIVREFIGRMALKPFVAKRKFALISNIENLNSQGANALLKTLEEPPGNTVIVLTANTRKVLPTIFSRCMVFNFNRGSKRGSEEPRIQTRISEEGKEGMSLLDFAGKALSERLLAINQFADLEEADLKQSIEDFIYNSARQLSQAPEKYGRLAAGMKAYEDLGTNKNRKLALQGLFTKI